MDSGHGLPNRIHTHHWKPEKNYINNDNNNNNNSNNNNSNSNNNNNNNNNNNVKIFKSKRFQLTNCGMIYQCTFWLTRPCPESISLNNNKIVFLRVLRDSEIDIKTRGPLIKTIKFHHYGKSWDFKVSRSRTGKFKSIMENYGKLDVCQWSEIVLSIHGKQRSYCY